MYKPVMLKRDNIITELDGENLIIKEIMNVTEKELEEIMKNYKWSIAEEMERLGLDDLEDIDLLKEMGLTTAAYPEYDEDIIEAVMNMLDVPLEKALKIWDNDNTRFDYYEYIGYKPEDDAYVALAVHRIVDLEEIAADNDDCEHFSEEANNLRHLYDKDHDELRNYMLQQGWMVYEFIAIGWDLEELNKFMEMI